MTYSNLTNNMIKPLQEQVREKLTESKRKCFFKEQILSRSAYLLLIPASIISVAIDTILGVGAGLGALATCGRHANTFRLMNHHLQSTKEVTALPFLCILLAINPSVNMLPQSHKNGKVERIESKQNRPLITQKGDGFLSHYPIAFFHSIIVKLQHSKHFFTRHVISRLSYALLAITCVITRLFDAFIGIPAAGLALLTGGKFAALNHLAYRALQAPGIVSDLFYSLVKVINPLAGAIQN